MAAGQSPLPATEGEDALVTAQHLESPAVLEPVLIRLGIIGLGHRTAQPQQLTLGGKRGGLDQREAGRTAQIVASGDVDDPEHLTSLRVAYGGGRARPGLHAFQVTDHHGGWLVVDP